MLLISSHTVNFFPKNFITRNEEIFKVFFLFKYFHSLYRYIEQISDKNDDNVRFVRTDS